jgi:hypothetical protein
VSKPRSLKGLASAASVVLGAGLVTTLVSGDSGHPHRMAIPPAPRPRPSILPPTTTTTAPAATGADALGQVQPPAPGLYRYRTTSAQSPPSEYAQQVTQQTSSAGVTTDKLFSTRGVSTTVTFTATGELELGYSQVGSLVTDEVTCPDNPPVLLLRLPLQAGVSWTASRPCSNILGDRLTFALQTRVIGTTTQAVADRPVPVWELVTVITDTDAPAGGGPATTRQETITEDVSATSGLVVRQVVQQGTDPSTIQTDHLISLDPA